MPTNSQEQEEQKTIFSHRFDPAQDKAIDAFGLISSQTISMLMMLSSQFEDHDVPTISNNDMARVIYAAINGIKDMEAIYSDDHEHQFNANRVKTGVDCIEKRSIRSRDDLSFTKRDEQGRFLNWFMPDRNDNWHEHYGIGEIWFNEIVELARHDTQEAYYAMKCAGPELVRYWNYGHPDGFFDRMARWALAGIMAHPDEPIVPFQFSQAGKPPVEGMDYHLNRAADSQKADFEKRKTDKKDE